MKQRLPIVVAAAAVAGLVLALTPWASGSPQAASAPPQVIGYSSYENGPIAFTPTPEIVGTLALPKGKFIVNAKVIVEVVSGPTELFCRLDGAAEDIAKDEHVRADADGLETLPLTASAVLTAPGSVDVVCQMVGGGTGHATAASITAVKVTTLRATPTG
jgi:hypothetical protein